MVNVPFGEVLLWCSALAVMLYTFTAHPLVAKGIPKAFLTHVLGLNAAAVPAPVFDVAWVAGAAAQTTRATVRAFGSGYALRAALALVRVLMGGRLSVKNLLSVVYSAEHVHTGAFFGSMALLHWAVRHALLGLRRTDDAWNHAAAGFAAGLPFIGLRSTSIALYFGTKAAEAWPVMLAAGLMARRACFGSPWPTSRSAPSRTATCGCMLCRWPCCSTSY